VIAVPIEIRELVIRATVDPKAEAAAGGCGSSSPKVLRILDGKRER